MKSARRCCPTLIKSGFYQQVIKVSDIKFHENSSSGSRIDTGGQTAGRAGGRTDRHAEAKRLFFDHANAPKKIYVLLSWG